MACEPGSGFGYGWALSLYEREQAGATVGAVVAEALVGNTSITNLDLAGEYSTPRACGAGELVGGHGDWNPCALFGE